MGYGDKEKDRAYCKEYYWANRKKRLLKNKQYREKNKKERYFSYVERVYNLTRDEWESLFELQEGCCAICGKHQSQIPHCLCVDHNHKTGEVRGLLCKHCNGALGWYENRKADIDDYLKL